MKRCAFFRRWLWTLYLPVSVIYLELVYALSCGAGSGGALWAKLLFSVAAGLCLTALAALCGGKAFRAVSSVLLALLTVYFCVQTVYRGIFQTTLGVGLMGNGGDAIANFGTETLNGILRSLPAIVFLCLPFVLWLLLAKRLTPQTVSIRCRLCIAALFLLLQLGTGALVRASDDGALSPAFLYGEGFVLDPCVSTFGLLTALRLDLAGAGGGSVTVPEATLPAAPISSIPTASPAPAPVQTAEGAAPPEETAAPFVPQPQVLDIDFAALYDAEWNSNVKALHSFFAGESPSYTNAYTGLFAGKNLIWICAESFSPWACDETHCPTLYRLANSGFVFENFYCPLTGASTTGGEFITLTGLMQNSSQQLMQRSGRCFMPYGMGNLLNPLGYTSIAYHNGQYTFYGRQNSHPNLGYAFRANGNGLTLDEPGLAPTSDLDMFKNSVEQYLGAEKFNIYYMTISGHMDYKFGAHAMCDRYREQVEDLEDYTKAAKAYVACQMDFDRGMEVLLDALADAGKLEDTVIVISPDHYPYGLSDKDFESMLGHKPDKDFEKVHSTLILWCGDMEEPVYIDKPCSSIDILPTLLNLFGIPFESRILMGRDILSDSPGFVAFPNFSFLSALGRYSYSDREFIPASEDTVVPDEYVSDMIQRIRVLYKYSEEILNNNYYDKVIPADFLSRAAE